MKQTCSSPARGVDQGATASPPPKLGLTEGGPIGTMLRTGYDRAFHLNGH